MSVLPSNFETLKRRAKQSLMPLLTPHLLKLRLNTYAPYIGAGIKIDYISLDQGLCVVSMGLTTLNKNIVGTQFGGSLYSMVDPFYMLMLMHQLGSNYVVWDKTSHIEFVAPGNSRVTARMKIPSTEVITIQGWQKMVRLYFVTTPSISSTSSKSSLLLSPKRYISDCANTATQKGKPVALRHSIAFK